MEGVSWNIVWQNKPFILYKVPAILYFERTDTRDALDYSGLPDEIDAAILSRDTSISMYVIISLNLDQVLNRICHFDSL